MTTDGSGSEQMVSPLTLKRMQAEVVAMQRVPVSNLIRFRRIVTGAGFPIYEVTWKPEHHIVGYVRKSYDEDHGLVWSQHWPWQGDTEAWGSAYKGNRGEATRELLQVFVYHHEELWMEAGL